MKKLIIASAILFWSQLSLALEIDGTSEDSKNKCIQGLIQSELQSTSYAQLTVEQISSPWMFNDIFSFKASDSNKRSYTGRIHAKVEKKGLKTSCQTLRETSYSGSLCKLGCPILTFELTVETQLILKYGTRTEKLIE